MGAVINVKENYFFFLLSLLNDSKHKSNDYTKLCSLLHRTPFVVLNPMDDNRVSDAKQLRSKWLSTIYVRDERLKEEYAKDINSIPISMFEILVALAIHINDYVLADPDKPELPANLFWNFIDNIVAYGQFGSKYTKASQVLINDKWCDFTEKTMSASLDRIINRTYHPDGVGGLFPLKDPKINQRKEELWTCCMAYINENYY